MDSVWKAIEHRHELSSSNKEEGGFLDQIARS